MIYGKFNKYSDMLNLSQATAEEGYASISARISGPGAGRAGAGREMQ
jgi:hypothetical protein